MKYEVGSKAYIVESNYNVREVTIVSQKGDYRSSYDCMI